MWTCPKCGLPNQNPTACNRCQSPPPGPVEGLRPLSEPLTSLEWLGLLRMGGGGVLVLIFGIWYTTSPLFQQNPNVFSLTDALPGVGAAIGGVIMAGLVVWRIVDRRG